MIDNVKIGAIRYQVAQEPTLTDTGYFGQIRHARCQIAIAGELHPSAAAQTLWHEIIHGILTQAGITEQPENLVDSMAYGVLQVIRDNPDLVDLSRAEA